MSPSEKVQSPKGNNIFPYLKLFLYRFVNGNFLSIHEPTVGALFLTKKIKFKDYHIKFDIWDTAGQERFYSLTPMYYRNANAAVIVYDITNPYSFERAKKW